MRRLLAAAILDEPHSRGLPPEHLSWPAIRAARRGPARRPGRLRRPQLTCGLPDAP